MFSPTATARTLMGALAAAMVGCSFDVSGLGGIPLDAPGNDGLIDAPTDGAVDAPLDARIDARIDGGIDATIDATVDATVDGTVDGTVDAPPGCPGAVLPFDPSNIARCDVPAPVGSLDLLTGNWTFDTDGPSLGNGTSDANLALEVVTQDGGGEVVVAAVDDLLIGVGVTVTVTGSRPLIWVALDGMQVSGAILAAAQGSASGGGAASPAICGDSVGGAGVTQQDSRGHDGGSGGGGGGYGGAGGSGAIVQGSAGTSPTPPGDAGGNLEILPLRGGCAGGDGGNGGGAGGGGGGAIQLVAGSTIQLTGTVAVAGGGGAGAPAGSVAAGGGGGGSGGAILIETVTLAVSGAITANGGGGGEGRSLGTAAADHGDNGHLRDGNRADGGNGGVLGLGGNGGRGGALQGQATNGQRGLSGLTDAAGGGGGGGGFGRIHLRGTLTVAPGAVISPAPR